MKKYCASFAAAAAMLAVLFTDPVAHAADLELAADQPERCWEFTERGVNFAYMSPDRKVHLERFFEWFRE